MSKDCANRVQFTSSRSGKLMIFQCSYKWVISSFNRKDVRYYQTPSFTIDDCFGTSFSLRLEKHGIPQFCYHMYLRRNNDIPGRSECFLFNTEFSVLDSNYIKKHTVCSGIISSPTCSVQDLISEETLLKNPELLPNDTLTILCNFQLVKTSEEVNPVDTTSSLCQDIKCLFEQRRNVDIILQIGNESVEAHKFVLTTRSSVFAAMFENEMKESRDNKVNITDITKDVLEEFLRYMYTDEIPNLKTMAMGLLGAAEKYHVESLKGRCEKHLLETVTVGDAAEILMNADLYNSERLKKGVIQFINSNKKDFVKTEGYKMLRESHGRLVFEIFEADTSD